MRKLGVIALYSLAVGYVLAHFLVAFYNHWYFAGDFWLKTALLTPLIAVAYGFTLLTPWAKLWRLLGVWWLLTHLLAMVPATVLASGEGLHSLVRDIGICIVLAGLLAIIFVRLKIPEIAAFLLAGVVVGPVGTGMVTDPANIETISELGLILLLYLIELK